MRLIRIDGYYKISKGRLIQCRITEKPGNLAKIFKERDSLRKEYGKDVSVKVVIINGKKYVRWQRSDGIPIYIDIVTKDVYVPKKYERHPLISVALRYFLFYAGYKVKERMLIRF